MTTLSPRFDRAAIETQILAIARDLLHELGDTSGAGAVCSSSIIDRDLGLGSIERVELLSRIERTFGISLPENAVSDAVTLGDIVSGIARAAAGEGASIEQHFDSYPRAEGNSNARDFIFGVPASQTPRNADTFRRDGEPRGFRRIFEMLYGVFAATVFLLWLVFTWLIVLAMPPGSRAARITSKALQLYFRVIGCRITVDGREHLDAYGSCIYVSNHTSYSDVLVVMAVVHTDYRFVAKSEINDMPFIGTFLRKLGHFAFERGKLRARSRQAEQMGKALLRGESLFVFAEGTFTAEPGVRPFQLGAFRAAVKTGRPIVPVALRGTRYLLQDGTFLPKPSRITVTVSPALFANLTPEGGEWTEVLRLRDETRRIISSHSGEPLLSRPEGPPQPPDNPSSA